MPVARADRERLSAHPGRGYRDPPPICRRWPRASSRRRSGDRGPCRPPPPCPPAGARPWHAPPPSVDLGRDSTVRRLRSEEHTSELKSLRHLVCRLLLEK